MATKSIYKTICIKDKKSAKRLVNALEHAAKKLEVKVNYSRPVSDASSEDIRKMFGRT